MTDPEIVAPPTRSRRSVALLSRYVAMGLISVVIDAGVYAALVILTGNPLLSKSVSYVCGALFSYLANWRFTFGQRRGKFSEVAFVLVYATSLGVNVGVNEVLLLWFGDAWWRAPLAFFVSTSITTVWNFVGQALFVFREPDRHASLEPAAGSRE